MIKILQFLAIIALVSCSNHSKNNNIVLKPVGQAKFPIDDATSYQTSFINTHTDAEGNEQMIFLGRNKPSILIYNIKNQKLVKEILLEFDGPNGVGDPIGLLYHSQDSIFIFSGYQITLINNEGKAIRKYNSLKNNEKPNDNTGLIRPFTISPPILLKSTIFMNTAPDRHVYRPYYFDGNTRLSLDITTGLFRQFDSYPKEFKNRTWGSNAINFSTDYDGNNFIYSFTISDSIYVAEKTGSNGYLAKTSLTKKKEILPLAQIEYEPDQYLIENIQYMGIIYDKYRDVYYRFVVHPISYKDVNGDINGFHDKPISIIVLNKSLEIIGEVMLEEDKYRCTMYFVAEEGLFISNANPKNKNLDENFTEFTIFKLEQK